MQSALCGKTKSRLRKLKNTDAAVYFQRYNTQYNIYLLIFYHFKHLPI